VTLRNGQSPRRDLIRGELSETHLAQSGSRLAKQPAELRDRDAFALVFIEVLLDPLGERERLGTTTGQEAGQLVL
jgi:hypothetical protein